MSSSISAISGRVTKIKIEGDAKIAGVKVLDGPENGYLTVDPDMKALSYVSTDPKFSGSERLSWEISYEDGRTEKVSRNLEVETGPQAFGWATGENVYMLRTDENDEVIVEAGENHRKIYVTGSEDGLTKEDIEEIEGVKIGSIGRWLKANPDLDYGKTEELAVSADVGRSLWYHTSSGGADKPTSNWLLLERGYEYDDFRIVGRGANGESPLNPMHITSYGEGDLPVLTNKQMVYQRDSQNIVISDIEFGNGYQSLEGANFILEDIVSNGNQINIQHGDRMTLRQSEILDSVRDAPDDGRDWWPHPDRVQGVYVAGVEGLLMEQNFIDHNGWEKGYDANGESGSGQPPSMYSHNVYLQAGLEDVTFRDNVSMRGASFGVQVRSSGMIEDNLLIDNNAAYNSNGGNGGEGHYSLSNGNLITSGAHKVAEKIGGLTMGQSVVAKMSTLVDNIVAHMADPNNEREHEDKKWTHNPSDVRDAVHDDTIVFNWQGSPYDIDKAENGNDQNIDGRDIARMLNTTIQNYASKVLGRQNATIDDLAERWREITKNGGEVDRADLLKYFREGFGVDFSERKDAQTVTFVPNELADGVRWDNRLNWDTGDIAGSVKGDAVDLNGSFVYFGGSYDVTDMTFGETGHLVASHGYLGIETVIGDASVEIKNAGQVWVEASDGEGTLSVDIESGRFYNRGFLNNDVSIHAAGGQTVLASGNGLMQVASGVISIQGGAKVGFDGENGSTAGLRFDNGVALNFGSEGEGLGTIREFRTGAHEVSDVASLVDLSGAEIEIDVAGLEGLGTHTLIEVDNLSGEPQSIDIVGLDNRDAIVSIDLDRDVLSLKLVDGDGETHIETTAQSEAEASFEAGLWDDLEAFHGIGVGGLPPFIGELDITWDLPDIDFSGATHTEGNMGTDGSDIIRTNGMNANISARGGNDWVEVGGGVARVSGGSGDDVLVGGEGMNMLRGDDGDDVLIGSHNKDILIGGSGNDILDGRGGNDMLMGGSGADIFVFHASNTGRDTATASGFNAGEGDRVLLTGSSDLWFEVENVGNISLIHVDDGEGGRAVAGTLLGADTDIELIGRGEDYILLG